MYKRQILLGMLALLGGANSIQFTCMNTLTLIDLTNADASSGNSLLSTIMQLSIAVSIDAASQMCIRDSSGKPQGQPMPMLPLRRPSVRQTN